MQNPTSFLIHKQSELLAKAQDKLDADSVKELKAIYGDGNLTGTQASEIITNWNDKVS